MQREAVVGLGKRVNRPSATIALAPPPAFLGRLADEHQRAAPLVLEVEQDLGDGDPGRHVDVVAAGMHDRRLRAAQHLLHLAGVG